jgi:hypothetical protein
MVVVVVVVVVCRGLILLRPVRCRVMRYLLGSQRVAEGYTWYMRCKRKEKYSMVWVTQQHSQEILWEFIH